MSDKMALEVTAVFDTLAGEVYHGFNFRMFLMDNPEELRKLKSLLDKIENDRMERTIAKLIA